IESAEEAFCHFSRYAIDEPGPDLRDFSADVGFRCVAEARLVAFRGELDVGFALGEPGVATLALEKQLVAIGGVDFWESDLCLELGIDRADFRAQRQMKLGIGDFFHGLATGYA